MTVTDLRVPATDGFSLAATMFEVGSEPSLGVVLIAPASGVKRGYYARYASFLAEQGFRVITLDYRGVGGSRPDRLRGFQAHMHEWARKDLAGVIDWIGERYRGEKLLLVGQSFGGQAIGLLPRPERIRAALVVAAQSGYHGHWSGVARLRVLALWYVLIPGLCRLFGYLPARALGLGEDLPGGVAREWARWGRHPGYILEAGEASWREGFARVEMPICAYSFSDDWYAPRAAVDALMSFYARAPIEHRHLRPRDVGAERVGHWGFFREGSRETLWRESASWLRRQL